MSSATPLEGDVHLRLPPSGRAPAREDLRELRRFVLGRADGVPLPDGALPAALAPFADPRHARNEYPLFLDDELKPVPLADLPPEHGKPSQEELLGLTPDTPLRLLSRLAHERVCRARAAFRRRVGAAVEGLRDLSWIEGSKDASSRRPQALQDSLGPAAGSLVDAEALAKAVGPHRGSSRLDSGRRDRLRSALAAMEKHLATDDVRETVLEEHGIEACFSAGDTFDHQAAKLAELLRALRLAELELRSAYDPDRHDPLLADLDWHGFTAEELHVLPVVVAVTRAEEVAHTGMLALSRLLSSGRPVQVLVLQSPARNPAAGTDELFESFRLEIAYLAMAHREAWVQQSTASRPTHLVRGFTSALAGMRAALHVVDTGLDAGGEQPPLGTFLHAGAAIEGRAHPLFQYDPEAGDTWARRLRFDHNPEPDADWPVCRLQCGDRHLDSEFTFADYALIEPAFSDQFSLLPDEWEGEDLVPLARHLDLGPEEAARRVPFVWVAAPGGAMHRAAVRRTLVLLCRDRLRFWRTLQELAGIRNDHVREAVRRAREEVSALAESERRAREAAHRQELERVRGEVVGNAMQNLARRLLDMAPAAIPAAAPARVPGRDDARETPPETPAPEAPEARPEQVTEEPVRGPVSEDPWIESARCSSCNDCIDLNPLLFVYDENKQARIGDPSKGTFAQLVKAAEKCPSRCIHPGSPKNEDEPGLERLVARAAPFNQ